MIQDYYKILEISPSATKEDIKKAYRKLAIKWHPDKNKSSNANEMFIKIHEAYSILYNDQTRINYDKEFNYYSNNRKNKFQKSSFSKNTHYKNKHADIYNNPDLNNYSKAAKEQAEKYASMSFEDFNIFLAEILNETKNQGLSAILFATSGIVGVSILSLFIDGIKYGDIPQIILSIIFFFILTLLISLIKNNINHET